MPDIDLAAPPLSLLVKLGSIAVHAEEFFSPKSHECDKVALEVLLRDKEVQQWIKKMTKAAILPLKR